MRQTQALILLVFLLYIVVPAVAGAALPTSAQPFEIKRIGGDAGEVTTGVTLPYIDGVSTSIQPQSSTTWGMINKLSSPYSLGSSGVSAARTGNFAYWVAGTKSQAYTAAQALTTPLYEASPWPNYLAKMISGRSPAVTVTVPTYVSGLESAPIQGYGAILASSLLVKKGATTLTEGTDFTFSPKAGGSFTLKATSAGALKLGGSVTVSSQFITNGTAGTMYISSSLADYYSARYQFYYAMPSLGVSERNYGLQLLATTDIGQPNQIAATYINTISSGWTLCSYDITSKLPTLSRSSDANFALRFVGVGLDAGETGAGPRVDDISLQGFKYGPVRNLSVSSSDQDVIVNWDTPYESKVSTTVDSRPIKYRVWRAQSGTDNFVELTTSGSPVSDTQFTDSGTAIGVGYTYLVQAFDGNAPYTQYGEMAPRSAAIIGSGIKESHPTAFSGVSLGASSVLAGGTTTITGTLKDSSTNQVAASQTVYVEGQYKGTTDWFTVNDSAGTPVSGTTNVSGVVQITIAPRASTNFRLAFGGWDGTTYALGSSVSSGLLCSTTVKSIAASTLGVPVAKHAAPVTLVANLKDSAGDANPSIPGVVAPQTLKLEQSINQGGSFTTISDSISTDIDGKAVYEVLPTVTTIYKWTFVTSNQYTASSVNANKTVYSGNVFDQTSQTVDFAAHTSTLRARILNPAGDPPSSLWRKTYIQKYTVTGWANQGAELTPDASGYVQYLATPAVATSTRYRFIDYPSDANGRESISSELLVKPFAKLSATTVSAQNPAYQTSVTVSALLSNLADAPVVGATVQLERSSDGNVWTSIGDYVTDATGYARTSFVPVGAYQYRYVFEGNELYAEVGASAASPVVIPQYKLDTTVADVTKPVSGGPVNLTSILRSNSGLVSGATVQVQEQIAPATSWTTLDEVLSSAQGVVSYALASSVEAKYRFYYPATAELGGPVGATSVLITPGSGLEDPAVGTMPASLGATVPITGTLLSSTGAGYVGAEVSLEKLVGSSWSSVDSTLTAADGSIRFTVVAGAATTYRFSIAPSVNGGGTSASVAVAGSATLSTAGATYVHPSFGSVVSISARVLGVSAEGLVGVKAKLQQSANGTSGWTDVGVVVESNASGYVSASTGSLAGNAYFRFTLVDISASSASVLVKPVRISAATAIKRNPNYGTSTTVSASITDGAGTGVSGIQAKLQQSSSSAGPWIDTTNGAVTSGAAGSVTLPVKPNVLTYYRFVINEPANSSVSAACYVKPYAKLSTPKKSVTYPRPYGYVKFTGYVYPKHTSTAYVTLYFEEKVRSGSTYKYVVRKTASNIKLSSTTSTSYSPWSYSSYKFPRKGTWRVRVMHSDTGHYTTYSSYLSVIVK